MKIAFVHDRRVHPAGAEAVLRDLVESIPHQEGMLFMLWATRSTLTIGERNYTIRTVLPVWFTRLLVTIHAWRLPILSPLTDYRNFIVILPWLVAILRFKIKQYSPDHVIISSFAGVKNVVPADASVFPPSTLYLHSPMQYIRENYTEYLEKLRMWQRWIFVPVARRLRKWDQKQRIYDPLYTNSHYTATCAQKYYKLISEVAYPRLHATFLTGDAVELPKEYMVFIGRLVRFVREVDRIIALANATKMPLLLIGSGPDENFLKACAGPTVVFLGQIDDVEAKKDILRHARGLINIAKESAGLATMEALACGVPVLGFAGGATPELVGKDGGILITSKEPAALLAGRERFQKSKRNRKHIQESFRSRYEQTRVSPIK